MDERALETFLLQSSVAGYAEGDVKTWTRESDQSTTIHFQQGPWRMHDNFFGGEPYGGREVVFHEDRPVWMLVYFGWVDEEHDPSQVYDVLRHALARMPPEAPFRGPKEYREGRFKYTNEWSGELGRLSGREQIVVGDSVAYAAQYSGGWVDRRQGV
jgi:hypothetical protein